MMLRILHSNIENSMLEILFWSNIENSMLEILFWSFPATNIFQIKNLIKKKIVLLFNDYKKNEIICIKIDHSFYLITVS